MGLLNHEERTELIECLLKIPLATDEDWRRSLLAGLPDNLKTGISDSSVPRIHLTTIVDTVNGETWARLADGAWAVLTLIENALAAVTGSQLAGDLQTLLDTLKARTAQQGS